jgi:hypothetical protein
VLAATAASPQSGEVLTELGTLEEVTYGTSKGGRDALWEHAFKCPKPRLAVTEDGDLVILGGSYKVNRSGIVG